MTGFAANAEAMWKERGIPLMLDHIGLFGAANAVNELIGERDRYRRALEVAVEDQIWMSGSADFSPEGIAHEGWIKVRERLNQNLDLLKEIKPLPEGVQA